MDLNKDHPLWHNAYFSSTIHLIKNFDEFLCNKDSLLLALKVISHNAYRIDFQKDVFAFDMFLTKLKEIETKAINSKLIDKEEVLNTTAVLEYSLTLEMNYSQKHERNNHA